MAIAHTRTNQRNGARSRVLSTPAGDVELRIPKVREGAGDTSGDHDGLRNDPVVSLAGGDDSRGLRSLQAALRALGDERGMAEMSERLAMTSAPKTDECRLTYVSGSNAAKTGLFDVAEDAVTVLQAQCSRGLATRLENDIRRARIVQDRQATEPPSE